jgi:hypothetical protein
MPNEACKFRISLYREKQSSDTFLCIIPLKEGQSGELESDGYYHIISSSFLGCGDLDVEESYEDRYPSSKYSCQSFQTTLSVNLQEMPELLEFRRSKDLAPYKEFVLNSQYEAVNLFVHHYRDPSPGAQYPSTQHPHSRLILTFLNRFKLLELSEYAPHLLQKDRSDYDCCWLPSIFKHYLGTQTPGIPTKTLDKIFQLAVQKYRGTPYIEYSPVVMKPATAYRDEEKTGSPMLDPLLEEEQGTTGNSFELFTIAEAENESAAGGKAAVNHF